MRRVVLALYALLSLAAGALCCHLVVTA